MSITVEDSAIREPPAPGRPAEIEAASNRFLVHPTSRALVDILAKTGVTPNQVSVASVFASAAAALSYALLAWPLNAFAGLAFQFVWHVLDGADGDLARRTGRASPVGELVDGVCDHLSQGLIYGALAFMAQRSIGSVAWAIAVGAAISHFLQANAYETGRKAYRRFVYGAVWMRQTGAGEGGLSSALTRLYLGASNLMSPNEAAAERAMSGVPVERARPLYRASFQPMVKDSGILGSNARTMATFIAVLVELPVGFFIFELTVLNVVLIAYALRRGRANTALAHQLGMAA